MGGGMGRTLSTIDLYVKKTVLSEALQMVKKKNEIIIALESFKSLHRILPYTDSED